MARIFSFLAAPNHEVETTTEDWSGFYALEKEKRNSEAEWRAGLRRADRIAARAERLKDKWTEAVERRAMAKKGSRKGGKKC